MAENVGKVLTEITSKMVRPGTRGPAEPGRSTLEKPAQRFPTERRHLSTLCKQLAGAPQPLCGGGPWTGKR